MEPSLEAVSYAADYAVTVDEASRRLDRAPALKLALQEIARGESDRLAGWGQRHEPDYGGWVYLVGEDPATDESLAVARANPDIQLRYGAAYTLAELDAAMDDPATFEPIPEAWWKEVAYREIDLDGNRIVVAFDRTADLDLVELNERLASAPVPVWAIEGDSTTPTNIQGGTQIDPGTCTSGFAVVTGVTRGLLTAGHCPDADKQWRDRTILQTDLCCTAFHKMSVFGDDGDSQWYTTTDYEVDNFYVNQNDTRDVTGYESRANMMGDFICHFGVKSGYSCGTVTQTNYDPNYQPECGLLGCDNRWIKVEGPNLVACVGDSGGPWFNNRTAYGIQSGAGLVDKTKCSTANTNHASFTAMDDVLDVLNVSLATS